MIELREGSAWLHELTRAESGRIELKPISEALPASGLFDRQTEPGSEGQQCTGSRLTAKPGTFDPVTRAPVSRHHQRLRFVDQSLLLERCR